MFEETVNSIIGMLEVPSENVKGDLEKYGGEIIRRLSFDSRDTGRNTLFVPTVGERVDSHRFISDVLKGEAIVSLSQEETETFPGGIVITVKNTLEAAHRIAAYYRETCIGYPVVGVTGSVGKTTTREMIAGALAADKRVYATRGNRNSQVGIVETVLGMETGSDIAVIEMGMSMPGEMEKLSGVVKNTAAVFTNIGVTHIENLGSRENILKEKMHITDSLPENAPVFIFGDNDMLKNAEFRKDLRVISFGMSPENRIHPENIGTGENGCPRFTASVSGKKVPVSLSVFGEHYIINALAALGVCEAFGTDLEKAARKIGEYRGYSHRQEITVSSQGYTIIDDTYNAAPDSVKAALDALGAMSCRGKKYAVLGDMKELGDMSVTAHRDIGEYARNKKTDGIITVGSLGRLICDEHNFSGNDELTAYLKGILKEGDTVLLKGSNSMRLFDVAEKLK